MNLLGWSARGFLLACLMLLASAVGIVDPRDELPWWMQVLAVPVLLIMSAWFLTALRGYRSLRRKRSAPEEAAS